MAKITYHGESEHITWHGVDMAPGKPVETGNADLIKAAEKHPMFTVSKAKAEKIAPTDAGEPSDKAAAGGAKAKAAGKPRNVPPAYRGKPAEALWLAGYDEGSAPDEPEQDGDANGGDDE